jgi:hypothetical protein
LGLKINKGNLDYAALHQATLVYIDNPSDSSNTSSKREANSFLSSSVANEGFS